MLPLLKTRGFKNVGFNWKVWNIYPNQTENSILVIEKQKKMQTITSHKIYKLDFRWPMF